MTHSNDAPNAMPDVCFHCNQPIRPGVVLCMAGRGYLHTWCAEYYGYVLRADGEANDLGRRNK